MANRNFSGVQAMAKEVKQLFVRGAYTALAAATGTLATTTPIVLTKATAGLAANGSTFTLMVKEAEDNPTDTILASFTGTAGAIVCTITPNDGTNNTATPVNLTTAELRELITTGLVAGKTVTITDTGSLRATVTATGGGADDLAYEGEGDGEVATFAGGADAVFTLNTKNGVNGGVTSITQVSNGRYRITLNDKYYALLSASMVSESTSKNDHSFQIRDEAVATAGTIDFILQSAASTNLGNTEGVFASIFVKNSSVI